MDVLIVRVRSATYARRRDKHGPSGLSEKQNKSAMAVAVFPAIQTLILPYNPHMKETKTKPPGIKKKHVILEQK